MKCLLICLFLTASAINLLSQKVSSYTINVEFFPDNAQMYNNPVSPDAFMRANSVVEFSEVIGSIITFYLHGELAIDSVFVGNEKIEFNTDKVLFDYNYNLVALKVTFNSFNIATEKKIHIHYSGFFNPSRARSLSDYMHINKDEGVYLRSYGYSLWFPIFQESGQDSYKADFKSITIKLPEKFKCVIGGELIKEYLENGFYTVIWKPGVSDILGVQCTARNYTTVSNDGVFIYFIFNKSSSEKVLNYALKLKKLYSENLRDINDSLHLFIMEMTKYGDISSGNVVGISERLFNTFEEGLNSKFTIAHELVHPYVYIPISTDNPFYAFVIEGFPSFFQVWAVERISPNNEFDLFKEMRSIEQSYLNKRKTGKTRRGNTLPIEKAILKISFDDIGTYKDNFILNDRVWLFFYDIWNQMGDDQFDSFLKELFSFNSVNYNNFEKLILKYTPGYKEKLNIWLNTTDYPAEINLMN